MYIFIAFKIIFSAIVFAFYIAVVFASYVAAVISKNFIILMIILTFTLHLIFNSKHSIINKLMLYLILHYWNALSWISLFFCSYFISFFTLSFIITLSIIIIINLYILVTLIRLTHEKLYVMCVEWTKLFEIENRSLFIQLLHAVKMIKLKLCIKFVYDDCMLKNECSCHSKLFQQLHFHYYSCCCLETLHD